jgi:two-component system cell cycle sensor histidine kinase/response regulator CckA
VSRYRQALGKKENETGRSETILIVNDDGTVSNTIREILNVMGYRALTVSTGEEALLTYRQHEGRIDLLVLYLMMPGMSRDEAFRQLKSLDHFARVILMSGYNVEKDLQELLSPGFDAFLKSLSRCMN